MMATRETKAGKGVGGRGKFRDQTDTGQQVTQRALAFFLVVRGTRLPADNTFRPPHEKR